MNFSLPAFNAFLNGTATVLLTLGFVFIKFGRWKAHRNSMVGALVVSAFFLFFYVLDKILRQGVHTQFGGEGFWQVFYYVMLISHVILAMIILPLIFRTLYLAVKQRYQDHRRWARFTYPAWYYVSVTGVLVYFFLYQWF